ncbi:MAG: type I secretion system permease/ATPase [Rhodospirillaceae bacterium]
MTLKIFAPGEPAGGACDSVLLALQYVARACDRPSAAVVLTSGLAMDEDGRLPFHQIEAAAERVGLRAHAMRKPVRGLLPRHAPALLERLDGGAMVLLEVKDKQYRIYDPAQDDERWWSRAGLEPVYAGRFVALEADPTRERGLEGSAVEPKHEHWFWDELKKYRGQFGYIAAAAATVNVLAFAMPLFTMNVYDRIIPNKAAASLWVLALGVFLALGFDYLLRIARARIIDEVGRDLDQRLAQRLFEKVMNIPLAARQGTTGGFARRLAEYEVVREFFTSTTVVLVIDMVFVFVFLALILALGSFLVLIPIVGIIGMLIAGYTLQKAMTEALKDAQADAGLQHSTLVEAIAGTETLKAIGAEGRMLGRWRRYADMSAATQERLRKLSAISVNLASFFQQAISVSLVVGGFYLFNANMISMGAIIAIVIVSGRALAPVGQFAFIMTRARQAMLTLAALQKIMDSPDERTLNVRSVTPVIGAGAIELDHASFRYTGAEADSLKDIQLTISPGERIGVIGRVASGKSTLGRVLCGLYAPTDGSYSIDGFDSRQFHPHQLRKAFRYVGQEAELFNGTVRENLLLGAAGASDEQMMAAVERSGADIFLARGATGFDLPVGERGSRLSGGQRSFMALARALIEPCRLLFLDEPTGAMDTQSEAYFIEKLGKAIGKDQTLMISTHRIAMLSLVSRLIVIDRGRIIADGPKAQVMKALSTPAAA